MGTKMVTDRDERQIVRILGQCFSNIFVHYP